VEAVGEALGVGELDGVLVDGVLVEVLPAVDEALWTEDIDGLIDAHWAEQPLRRTTADRELAASTALDKVLLDDLDMRPHCVTMGCGESTVRR
jgi:hypothetical protein